MASDGVGGNSDGGGSDSAGGSDNSVDVDVDVGGSGPVDDGGASHSSGPRTLFEAPQPTLAGATSTTPFEAPTVAPLGRVLSRERFFERYDDGVHLAPLSYDERMQHLRVIIIVLSVVAAAAAFTCVGIPVGAVFGFFAYRVWSTAKATSVSEAGTRFVIRSDGAHQQVVGGRAASWPLKKVTASYIRKQKTSGKLKTEFQLVMKLHDGTKQRFHFLKDVDLDAVVAMLEQARIPVTVRRES